MLTTTSYCRVCGGVAGRCKLLLRQNNDGRLEVANLDYILGDICDGCHDAQCATARDDYDRLAESLAFARYRGATEEDLDKIRERHHAANRERDERLRRESWRGW